MLRASQRRCEARRQTVAEQGYCWWCGDDDDDNDNEHTPGHPDDDDDGDDDEDFLDAIFSNRSSSSKPKLQRRKTMSRRRLRHPRSRSSSKQFLLEDDDDDDERIRRFEAAFTAMMASLSHGKYQGGTNNKIVATKIWTRPEQLDGELLSMEYSDWKIYGSNVKKPRDNTTGGIHNNNGSLDRSASWLVHLPTKEKKFSTAMRQHLTEVARRYLAAEQQQKLGRANGSNGTEDEEKYNWNENDDDDALTLVDHFERHAMDENNSNNNNINTFHDRDGEDNGISFGRRTILDRIARYNDDDNGHDAIRTKGVVQVLSPNTADLIRQFEEPSQSHNNNDEDEAQKVGSFVQRLVSHMEAATTRDREVLVSADGKLHKPAFARLIQHYLLSQSTATITRSNRRISSRDASLYSKPLTQSTTLPAMDQNNTPVFEANQEYSSGPNFCGREQDATLDDEIEDDETDSAGQTIPTFVRNFIEQIELDDEVNTVISADGTLDRPIFESLVQKYLAAATRKCLQNDVAETSPNPRQTSKEHDEMMRGRLQSGSDKPEDVDDSDPSQTSFLGHIHNAGHLLKSLTIGRSDSSSGSSKQPEPNSLGKGEITGDKKIATQDSLHAGKKLVGSVSNKVTELFHSLNSRSTTDEAAYSAFRSAQDKRRSGADDTASSQSSFSILPSGIRSVIKGYRDGKLPSAQYSGDDSDSEHKRETDNEDSADQFDDDDDDGVSENLSSPIGPESSNDLSSSHATRLAPALKEPNPNETVFYADGSLVSGDGEPGHTVGSLMLSPTLLTKRHKQVIRAVENRKWDQVRYLLSANPWLAEMADVNTNQYVLHKLSFYGSGLLGMDPFTGEVISLRFPSSPIQINMDLVRLFPSSVHKFDSDGNLPLHLAAASANVTMIKLLGEIFPGGASVRNEDGMLPLHLAIIACASPIAATFETDVAPNDIVQMITKYFPGALAVEDNEGNLPIHTAASVLQGTIGAEIVYFLIDESERQMSGPGGVRFRNKISLEAMDDKTIDTGTAVMSLDSCSRIDDVVNLMEIQNEVGNTPLSLAIQSRAGWEVIDALTCKSNDTQLLDSDGNNALHLLVCDRYKDPSAALAILRRIPELAKNRNENGMLPIEVS